MKTRYRGKKPLYFLVIKTIQILNMLPQVNHYYITVKQYNTLTLIQPNVGHLITSRGGPETATNIYVRLINV